MLCVGSFQVKNAFLCNTFDSYSCKLVQSIQLGFMFSWKQVTTILPNNYLTEFSKNLERIEIVGMRF